MARIVDAERPTGGEGAVRSLPGSCGWLFKRTLLPCPNPAAD